MQNEISLFSQEKVIQASKKFVCVRLGTYENKEHQDMIRDLLRGTMQNTAFVVFAPDGKTKLTRSGRSPHHVLGPNVINGMVKISNQYKPKNTLDEAILTDFHSFKQALNVSSASQRLLIWAVAEKSKRARVQSTLQKIFNDEEMSGKFFYDIADSDDEKWAENIKGVIQKKGIFIIRPGEFGTSGTIMKQLPHNSNIVTIKTELTMANAQYAKTEKRKVYSDHVRKGRKKGIDYHNFIEAGEDRDGDGEIDPKPRREGHSGEPPPR